jgi:hypothetical protein
MNCLKKITNLLSVAFVAFVLFNGAAFAQQITATLTGTISDPNGAVVPGAIVTATVERNRTIENRDD